VGGAVAGEGSTATRTCRICGRSVPPGYRFTHGRCRMCDMYWRRHGAERPAQPPQRPGVARPPLHSLRAAERAAQTRALPRLLRLLAPHRPGAPRATVAALMDPPEGYAVITGPVCGRSYETLAAAPVAFCSVACADTERRPSAPPAEPSHLFRAVRCSYCREPMRVAPRLRPPYRCPRCAGWRRWQGAPCNTAQVCTFAVVGRGLPEGGGGGTSPALVSGGGLLDPVTIPSHPPR
jgi:hypothetical protein